jgi:hypothetical protein
MMGTMGRSGFMDGASVARPTRRLTATGPKIARGLREASLALAFALFATALGTDAASAQSALAWDAPDAAALHSADDSWGTRGVASLGLPFGLRAHYGAQALDRLGPGHDLSAPYAELEAGASRHTARLIERRFALSRAVTRHLELELAWTARTPLSIVDLLRVEDQRVAAMIRFVP